MVFRSRGGSAGGSTGGGVSRSRGGSGGISRGCGVGVGGRLSSREASRTQIRGLPDALAAVVSIVCVARVDISRRCRYNQNGEIYVKCTGSSG